MEPSAQDDIKRAIEGQAVKARMDADAYTRKLREKPFWRFRRRQRIGKAIANARSREREALRLLDEG